MVLGHLAEAQYRLGDWDAAATNGALAVSLVRDAGVLLGAGVANAPGQPTSPRAAGTWDVAEDASRRRPRPPSSCRGGRPGACGDRAGGARPGPRRPRGDARGVAGLRRPRRPRPRRPGRGAAVAGAARRGAARARPDRRGRGRARRAGGAGGGASARLVGVEAARLRCEIAETARRAPRCAGPTSGRRRWRRRFPAELQPGPSRDGPRPVPARGRRAAPGRRPAAGRPRTARAAGRRAVPRAVRRAAARRRAAPADRGRGPRPHPAGARRRPPRRGGPHEPGGRRGAVRHGPDRRVPPEQHLRQARRLLPPRARRAAQQRTGRSAGRS